MMPVRKVKFREVTSKDTEIVCNRTRSRQWKAMAEL